MRGRPLAALLLAALLLALGAQTARGWARLRSSLLLGAVARQVSAARQLGRVPGPLVRGAEAALRDAARLDPAAIEPLAFRGDLLLVLGRHAEAAAAYERAAAHELRPEILLHHGLALWQLGRREEAVRQMRRAVAVAPLLADALPPQVEPVVAAAPLVPLMPEEPAGR